MLCFFDPPVGVVLFHVCIFQLAIDRDSFADGIRGLERDESLHCAPHNKKYPTVMVSSWECNLSQRQRQDMIRETPLDAADIYIYRCTVYIYFYKHRHAP